MATAFSILLACAALLGALLPSSAGAADVPASEAVLLVAGRDLPDPNFRESVILLTDHGRRGTVGVILNRPMPMQLRKLFPSTEALQNGDDPLYFGGPVSQRTLVFVFRSPERSADALHITDDIYMSMSPDVLAALLKRPEPMKDLRVYAGYAGWAPLQLRSEIDRGDWHVLRVDPSALFSKDLRNLWPTLIERATALQVRLDPAPRPVALAVTP